MGYTPGVLLNKLTIRNAALLALLAAATITLSWKAKSLEKRLLGHSDQPAMTNKQAPEFESQSLAGDAIALRNFQGKKKVVVSFWASWCEPCRAELPELKSFYEKNHAADSTFELIAVSTDENRFQAEKYAKEAKLPFPVVWDETGKISDAYGVESIPVLYVIDEHGKVIYGQTGYGIGLEIKLKMYLGLQQKGAQKESPDDVGSD